MKTGLIAPALKAKLGLAYKSSLEYRLVVNGVENDGNDKGSSYAMPDGSAVNVVIQLNRSPSPRSIDPKAKVESLVTVDTDEAVCPPVDGSGDDNANGVTRKWCATCGVMRPLRASHCRTTDRCVEEFDHYCPWIGNTVGRRNYGWFLAFLVSTSLSTAFMVLTCAHQVSNLAGRLQAEVAGMTPAVAWAEAVGSSVAAIVLGGYFLLCFTLVTLLLSLHLYLVSVNKTTAEVSSPRLEPSACCDVLSASRDRANAVDSS